MNNLPSIALITLMFASVVAAAEPESPPLTELIEKATHGDADAQLSLAMRYRDGKGRCGGDEVGALIRLRYGALNAHSSSLTSLGYGCACFGIPSVSQMPACCA